MGGMCIPLVLLLAGRLGKVFGTIVGIIGVLACLAAVELSGTRFALVALSVTAILYFLRGSGAQRVGLLASFVLLIVGSVMFLPKATLDRLATITAVMNPDAAAEATQDPSEAIGSLQERQQLFQDGLTAFVTHPIFGVGPNEFVDWRFSTLGQRSMVAHNTFLQIAAEEGFLGLVFYAAFIISALVTLYKCVKPLDGWQDGRQISLALEASLVYFVTSAFSLTCVTHTHRFVVVGLAVAPGASQERTTAGG